MAIQESESSKQVQLLLGRTGCCNFSLCFLSYTFSYWHIQSSLLGLTHQCPGTLKPISFVQPFQMYPINTTSQRKVFYLTPSCRQCTQMNILLLHTLFCTKIRHM